MPVGWSACSSPEIHSTRRAAMRIPSDRDAKTQRGERPFVFCDLKREHNLDVVIEWLERQVLFAQKPAATAGTN